MSTSAPQEPVGNNNHDPTELYITDTPMTRQKNSEVHLGLVFEHHQPHSEETTWNEFGMVRKSQTSLPSIPSNIEPSHLFPGHDIPTTSYEHQWNPWPIFTTTWDSDINPTSLIGGPWIAPSMLTTSDPFGWSSDGSHFDHFQYEFLDPSLLPQFGPSGPAY
ncbi:hypothetical protein TI39_contig4171g00003 [Zymoseptoria brevis]|uniref:Uncharacterized protein n=1 Tax=Zymoseptoria brevis TaxID=1047168 RepID=A0A0F4GC94_9PEZI|nr:hypothetical protein TI39_contig4171g00003 [Zymoseptoria brevis]